MAKKSEPLTKFLIGLANDSKALAAFKKNPDQAMDKAGLSDSEKAVIKSGDAAKIRASISDDIVAGDVVVVVVVVIAA